MLTQVRHSSSLVGKESAITIQTCGKFYAANNKRFPYRRGTADGIPVRLKFLDTNPSASSHMATVLAVHGSPGSYRDFSDLIERLGTKGYRVIAPNFPDMTLTDTSQSFYHSTGEKFELLTDFLAAIRVHSFDLAVIHSSGVYPAMKLWHDVPSSIRSLMIINSPGSITPRSLKPKWFINAFSRLNMFPLGRWFFKNYGYKITNAAKVSFRSSKENADNLALVLLTMYQAEVERFAQYAQALKNRKTPTCYIFTDRDALIELEIFHKYVAMLGGARANINIVADGQLVREAEAQLDWLRIFKISGGGHYAYKNNTALLEREAARLIDSVYSAGGDGSNERISSDLTFGK